LIGVIYLPPGNKNVASNYVVNGTTADDVVFTDCKFSVGFFLFNQSSAIRIIRPTYVGASGGKTEVANSGNLFNIISKTSDVIVDGLNFGGLTGVTQRGYLASVTTGSTDFTLKNIADIASPLDVGDAGLTDVVTSRSGAVCTIPHTAHGYVNGETIVVDKSDTSAIQPGAKVITYIDANSYSIPCTATGTATPKISFYYSAMTGILSGAAGVVDVTVQNVNVVHNSQAAYVTVTSNKDFIFENVYTEPRNPTQPTRAGTNITERSCSFGSTAPAAIAAVYGTIFIDDFLRPTTTPNPTGLAWTRSGSTISVPSPAHGLSNNDVVQVYDSSVPTGAINGLVAMTVVDGDNLTYTGLPVGTASGTLSYRVNDSRLSILMNEKNTDTNSYYTVVSNSAGLTGSGTVSMPTIGDKRYFITPNYIKGYNSAPNMLTYFLNLTPAQALAFNLTYDLDRGSGFSGTMKSLHAVRTGATGTSGTPVVTGLNNTTGLEVGAKVVGTGIAGGAEILTVDSSSQVTLNMNHIGTVSGSLTFNYLPQEATFPADGVKFKVEIETIATNTTPITALNIPLTSTSTTRARLYPQDTTNPTFELTELPEDTTVQIVNLDTEVEIDKQVLTTQTEYNYQYIYSANINARVLVWNADYLLQTYDIVLGSIDQSFPVTLSSDSVYTTATVYTTPTFDGDAGTIQLNQQAHNVTELYSRYKEWVLEDTNVLYPSAYDRITGGNLKFDSTYAAVELYFNDDDWQILLVEADGTTTVNGGYIYTRSGDSPYALTVGGYDTRVESSKVAEASTIAIGSGVTSGDKTDIINGAAAAVWEETKAAHVVAGTFGKSAADIEKLAKLIFRNM
jgi:hypothetical protein